MGSFGQIIPVIGTYQGFLGEVSRTGGGDPFIISKQANASNASNINFGDTCVIIPDSTGGTVKQFADWQANGGGLALSCTTASSTTVTPASATLAGLSPGMFIYGAGIPAGTYIVSVNFSAGTLTISKAATASATVTLYFVKFGGIAVREVKTMTAYTPTAGGTISGNSIGNYLPGQYVGLLVRGSITIKCTVGTPVAEGPAYLRTILNGSIAAGLVGDLEANADGVNNILLGSVPGISDARFKTGVIDSNYLTELTILNRIAA